MCGISGFIDFSKRSTLSNLETMNRTMVHRGPDGEGYFFDIQENATIGLGHRRLSIIDIEGSSQPMTYLHLTLTFNGEIYNYKEIKEELILLGHNFVTTGDTEVILHAWVQWGNAAIHKFKGMFAFAILDKSKNELICIRDRAGVKPFFYYWHEGLFLFGSELKALVAHPSFPKKINLDAVSAYMNYGYVPTPHCIYEHCKKLEPGHILQLSLEKSSISFSKYWDVNDSYNLPKLDISYSEAMKHTESLLTKAFEYRMVADVPVGVFLSGGYDSSLVAALLQKNSSTKLNTFTIGVGNKSLNEAPYAKEVSQIIGSEHFEQYCTEKDALDIVPKLPFYYDEPFGDSSAIPTILVSQLAAKHVKVSLSADAGDELFAGYYRYEYIQKLKKIDKIPAIGKKIIGKSISLALQCKVDRLFRHPLAVQRANKLKRIFDNSSINSIMANFTHQFQPNELRDLMLHDSATLSTYFDQSLVNQQDKLSGMMAMDYKTYLLDDILTKVDRATMSQSIEGREPFLDHELVEWASRLPNEFKYHKGTKKRILKDITHQYLPKEIMDRPKMGFAIPINLWMRNDLLRKYSSLFEPKYIQSQGIFNFTEIDKMISQFVNGNDQYALKVWHLLTFQLWYSHWMPH